MERPCDGQSPAELEAYYRRVGEGSLACIRRTTGSSFDPAWYAFDRVTSVARGRVRLSQHSSFWMKSGKNCYHPGGQLRLVIPSLQILDWGDNNPPHLTMGRLNRDEVEDFLWGRSTTVSAPPALTHTVYSIEDAERRVVEARAAYENADTRGNNPGRYQRVMREARERLTDAEAALARARQHITAE